MFEDVVSIPFDHSPIELLPPRTGDRESVRAGVTERGDRGWLKKVTLQIAVRLQLLKRFSHAAYSRMVTVRSLPGALPAVCVTAVMSRPICAWVCKGPRAKPSTTLEIVVLTGIVSWQYGCPFCVICRATGAPVGGCPTTAYRSRMECEVSTTR